MAKVIIGMTMSLDGYIHDVHGSVGALYPDLVVLRETAPLQEAMRNTGAVVMGRRTFAMAPDPDFYADGYEFQVPIFVLTHTVPSRLPKQNDRLTFTFVTDGLASAMRQAQAAAAPKDVMVVGGASTLCQCLQAGLADELHLDIMPVLLSGGLRLFDALDLGVVRLERLAMMALPGGRTHLRFLIFK